MRDSRSPLYVLSPRRGHVGLGSSPGYCVRNEKGQIISDSRCLRESNDLYGMVDLNIVAIISLTPSNRDKSGQCRKDLLSFGPPAVD